MSEDVPNARLLNIRTFVIGAPGSEQARARLSQMAWEGGTASSDDCDHWDDPDKGDCHFDMTKSTDFAADLNDALKEIAQTKILSCEFDVPKNDSGGGVDLDKVNVTFTNGDGDEEEILKDTSESCDDAMGLAVLERLQQNRAVRGDLRSSAGGQRRPGRHRARLPDGEREVRSGGRPCDETIDTGSAAPSSASRSRAQAIPKSRRTTISRALDGGTERRRQGRFEERAAALSASPEARATTWRRGLRSERRRRLGGQPDRGRRTPRRHVRL